MKPEQIREILNNADEEVVKDVAAILLAQGQASTTSVKNKIIDSTDFKNFSQAISYLKKNYKFPELNEFSTESDLVYVKAGDRKVLLTKLDSEKRETTSSKKFSNLDYDSEDSYFENAWEPLRKESKSQKSDSADNATNPFADTSVLSSETSDDKTKQTNNSEQSNSERDNSSSASKNDESAGGRFKNLEL